MNRHFPSSIFPALAITVLVALPARVADAEVSYPSWTMPLSMHQDGERLGGLKRKWTIRRPQLETSHTNQPPAPPAPPDTPLQDPDQGDAKRVIDLTPGVGSRPSIDDLLPLPGPGDALGVDLPDSGIAGGGFWLGPIDFIPGPDEGLAPGIGVDGVGTAAPSVVPGPGAIGLLLAAGLAGGQRRRRG